MWHKNEEEERERRAGDGDTGLHLPLPCPEDTESRGGERERGGRSSDRNFQGRGEYRVVQKKGTVLLSTSLAWPAVAGCSWAETFSQLSSISFAQPCRVKLCYVPVWRPAFVLIPRTDFPHLVKLY